MDISIEFGTHFESAVTPQGTMKYVLHLIENSHFTTNRAKAQIIFLAAGLPACSSS